MRQLVEDRIKETPAGEVKLLWENAGCSAKRWFSPNGVFGVVDFTDLGSDVFSVPYIY